MAARAGSIATGLILEQRGYHDEADPWKETRVLVVRAL
jgi:hypothetical protein